MQSGLKPYTTWGEAFVFFLSLEKWLNRSGVKTLDETPMWSWQFCERCWIYHRGVRWCGRRKAKC